MAINVLLLVLLAGATGCTDDCSSTETICAGTRILRCAESDGILMNRWEDSGGSCAPASCVDAVNPAWNLRTAVCSSSGELDPRCADGGHDRCVDPSTLLECELGYGLEVPCTGSCIGAADGSVGFCSS